MRVCQALSGSIRDGVHTTQPSLGGCEARYKGNGSRTLPEPRIAFSVFVSCSSMHCRTTVRSSATSNA